MTKQTAKINVRWDGVRVYRVPTPNECEALWWAAQGLNNHQIAENLGLASHESAYRRIAEAQAKLRACSEAEALYHSYRLGIFPNPWDPGLKPLLDEHQRGTFVVVVQLGLPYDHAHKQLGISRNRLVAQMEQIYDLLGASNRVQAMSRAVQHGDVRVIRPAQFWAGQI